MANERLKPNIPPGELGRIGGPSPRNTDRDITIRPLLDEMEANERKALKMRR